MEEITIIKSPLTPLFQRGGCKEEGLFQRGSQELTHTLVRRVLKIFLFMKQRAGLTIILLFMALFLLPAAADAHLVNTGFGTFYDGVVHLFITPSDILVALGLGLLAGLCGAPA